ncbi:MAG TPA: class III poly(R)-hydroxyalkanoic acid synthase subunit PhaC [Desulfotomaculum sp.]|nr:class III poly(R)-hydroxyalkanoic acid synthase subunit PhaC [Desulfotomaculum sp.]
MDIIASAPSPQTGLTPKDVIWRKNKAELYRYRAVKDKVHPVPVLMLYALINKPYILDLYPGNSLVEYLVNNGFDVYMLDWGTPSWEDKDLSFNELILDYILRAVEKVAQTSGTKELTLLGYCMGGTMSVIYTALQREPIVRNMVLIAAPIDFTDAGICGIWVKRPDFNLEKVVDTYGLIPSDFIDNGTKILNPVNNYLGTYTRLWKMIYNDIPVQSWMALNKWVNDGVPFPGGAYRQWIGLYKENSLVKKEFTLRGYRVDLAHIESSVLALAGGNDHIVLPGQVKAILEHISAQDKTYLEFPVGHGGLVFGSLAVKKVFPAIKQWLEERSLYV